MAKKRVKSKRKPVRDQRRQKTRRLILWGITVLVVAILAIAALLIYSTSDTAIATVNGVRVRLDTYQKEIRYFQVLTEKYIQGLEHQRASLDPGDEDYSVMLDYYNQAIAQAQQASESQSIESQALQGLINDELIREGAKQMGIFVSEQDLQNEIYRVFGAGVGETGSALGNGDNTSLSQEQHEENYKLAVARAKKEFGMNEEEFRDLLRRQALRAKFALALAEEIPSAVEQVHIKHILVAEEEGAMAVADRLAEGEDFAAVAAEVSLDQRSKDQGGDLGWFPRGTYAPVFEDQVFALESEGDIAIAKDSAGFHVVMLVERDDSRPLPPGTLEHRRRNALAEWLQKQRAQADISYNVDLYRELFMQ
jgi:foldase protein PrsA